MPETRAKATSPNGTLMSYRVEIRTHFSIMSKTTRLCGLGRDDRPNQVDYYYSVSLFRADGSRLATCTRDIDWDGGDHLRHISCDIRIADPEPTMTTHLGVDADHDGRVSPGDQIFINVRFRGGRALNYTDMIGDGLTLVPGLVGTNVGRVAVGNGERDSFVRVVDLLDAAPDDTITIAYAARVDHAFIRNQGVATVTRLDNEVRQMLTHWPEIEPRVPRKPTETPVFCNLDGCNVLLNRCRTNADAFGRELEECDSRVDEMEAEIEQLTNDDDGDNIIGGRDECPNTPSGMAVDDRGCSPEQFCNAIVNANRFWYRICTSADWRNDEPLSTMPRDCQADRRRRRCTAIGF